MCLWVGNMRIIVHFKRGKITIDSSETYRSMSKNSYESVNYLSNIKFKFQYFFNKNFRYFLLIIEKNRNDAVFSYYVAAIL